MLDEAVAPGQARLRLAVNLPVIGDLQLLQVVETFVDAAEPGANAGGELLHPLSYRSKTKPSISWLPGGLRIIALACRKAL
jgi:hypothetical protein